MFFFFSSRRRHTRSSTVSWARDVYKRQLGGYIVVKAESADEAAEFAKGAPVLQSEGNTVEVREIMKH